jgi:hypothetical protein
MDLCNGNSQAHVPLARPSAIPRDVVMQRRNA